MTKLFSALFSILVLTEIVFSAIPTNGLVAYYPFNANANDVSGNGNDGILHGATLTADRFGNANSAYYFNGSSYIDCGNAGLPNPAQFTISIWAMSPVAEATYATIIDEIRAPYNNSVGPIWGFHCSNASSLYRPYFRMWSSGTSWEDLPACATQSTCQQGFPQNTWIHFVGTYDGIVQKFYINDSLIGSRQSTLDTGSLPKCFIGASMSSAVSPAAYWIGSIDDIRIYNRALSDSEINALYNEKNVPLLIPYEPKITLNRLPTFTWHSMQGATTYAIDIAQSSDFASPIATLSEPDTTFQPLANLPLGTIYWKVKSDLTSLWSSLDSFFIQSDSIPFLIRFSGASVTTKRPTFVWHPVANASTYKIQVSQSSNFSSPTTLNLPDTTFTMLADCSPGTWYWTASDNRNYNLFAPIDSLVIQTSSIFSQIAKPSIRSLDFVARGKVCKIYVGNVAADVTVFSMNGQQIAELHGRDFLSWNYGAASSGLYLIEVKSGMRVLNQRVIVNK